MGSRCAVRSCAGASWLSLTLFLLFLFAGAAWGQSTLLRGTGDLQELPASVCAPDRVIVKLTPNAAMGVMGRAGQRVPPGLERAMQRAMVREARPLFGDLWPGRGQGPIRAADRARAVQASFPGRGRRAPAGAAVPDLENMMVLTLEPGASVEYAVAKLKQDPEVIYAEPDLQVQAQVTPDDPYYSSTGSWGQSYLDLWGLHKIHAAEAWDVTTGSDSVVIAVVDTGLDYTHPDIAGRVWTNGDEIPGNAIDDDGNGYVDDVMGWDFVGADARTPAPDNDPMDGYGHGTHVSGTIAAATDNGLGVAGINWAGKIMPVKGLDDRVGGGWISDLALALRYAADSGADVVNNSWGGFGTSQTLQDAVDYCHGLGCLVVGAAGNNSMDAKDFVLAGLRNVVSVAATDPDDVKAYFSNYGEIVDISAPGVDILSLRAAGTDFYTGGTHIVGADYYRSDGTSMSAPHVAGALALLIAAHPAWTAAQLVGQLNGTADDIDAINPDYAGQLGLGRLNLAQALGPASTRHRIIYLGYVLDDSLGDGDGQAEAGERVRLYVRVKHFTGETVSPAANLTTSDSYLTMVDGAAAWGTVSGWQALDNAADPFVLDVSALCPRLHMAELTLTLSGVGYSQDYTLALPVSMYVSGWPVAKGGGLVQYPILADVDSDDAPEVVVSSDAIHVINGDGLDAPGWPVNPVPGYSTSGWKTPHAGDVDGDGSTEVAWIRDAMDTGDWSSPPSLWVWRADGSVQPGFPVTLWPDSGVWIESVTLADLDGQPGDEILVVITDRTFGSDMHGRVEVFRHDGTRLPEWPTDDVLYVPQMGYGHTAIGDINGDGDPEVVLGEARRFYTYPSEPNRVWAWRADGTLLPGFPVELSAGTTGDMQFGPALGDIDGDGAEEIAISSSWSLYLLRGDGTVLPGWPQDGVPPALADLDRDGSLEIIAGGVLGVRVYEADGRLRWFGSHTFFTTFEPVIADVDGDSDLDVLVRDQMDFLWCWHSDGAPMEGFPLQVGPRYNPDFGVQSSVAVGDIDADGYIDIITGNGQFERNLYAYAAPGRYNSLLVEWQMMGANPQNTGRYGAYQAQGHGFRLTATASPSVLAAGKTTTLSVSVADTDGHSVVPGSWSWSDGGAGGTFTPSAFVQDPTYTVPTHCETMELRLAVTATCDGPDPLTDTHRISLLVPMAATLMERSLPSALTWDQSSLATIAYRNDSDGIWHGREDYYLLSRDPVNRWGLLSTPFGGDLNPGETFWFNFDIVAPPATTLRYDITVTPTAPLVASLACDWDFVRQGFPLMGGGVSQDITVSRFPDIQPGTAGAWARFCVEQCAGRVPMIVGGYGDGTYRPTLTVDRGAMAVFMARAMKLSLPSYQGRFNDVPSDHWAVGYIEALAGANVVSGYEDGSYRPADLVNRGAMAVYVARGLAGGDSFVPPGPGTPSFPDVPLLHWAFKYVEYAKSQGVVGGYPDGSYWPDLPVDRGQMAVYVYRGFIQPTGAAVVLAGPAVTAVSPATGGECGWASAASHYYGQSRHAYVAFDAMRLGPNLLYPQTPSGTLEVRFELRNAETPTTPATDIYTHTESLSADQLLSARAAAWASGYAHYSLTWQLPTLLALGDYLLVVSVQDETGRMQEVARRPALTFYQP